MADLIIAALVYIVGLCITCGVFCALGEKHNPKYGSWTGDTQLDILTLIVWPLSWVVLASWMAGKAVGRIVA